MTEPLAPPPDRGHSFRNESLSLSQFVERAVGELSDASALAERTSELEAALEQRLEPFAHKPDRISRMFQTSIGRDLYGVVRNEMRSVALLGVYAAELARELMRGWEPGPSTVSKDGAREIAVFGPRDTTDVLLLYPDFAIAPIGVNPATVPGFLKRVPGVWKQLRARLDDEIDSEYLKLLLDHGDEGALDAILAIQPRIVFGEAPRMKRLSAPWPPFNVVYKYKTSTAGVLARDNNGKTVVTVAYHATGEAGEKITIQGLETTVVESSPIFDTSYADFPDNIQVSTLRGRAGPMIKRPPARGEQMEFFGAKSRMVSTVVEGVDLGIPRVDRGRMRCVQTRRDTNPGDSGAALINSDDETVGFCYSRTEHNEPLEFADWVWAKSVYDVLELQPY
jgi:hypothetical protein